MGEKMNPEQYLDALLSLPGMVISQSRMVGPKVSPDKKWGAWSWYRTGPAADVYIAPVDGSSAPIRLSETPENTFIIEWMPDSRAVIVSQDESGNERDQLFRIDLDRPGVLVPLTEPKPPFYLIGGQVHPNGKWLIYGANYDVATGMEIEPAWIYRHDLETGERIALARLKTGFTRPFLSEDGQHILYTRCERNPAGRQVWLADINGQEDREILNPGDRVKTFGRWFPDSRRVLVMSDTATHRRIGVWSLDNHNSSVRWLVDDPARNIENAYVPLGSEEIVLLEVREARLRASLLNPDTGAEQPLHAETGNLQPITPLGNGEWVGQFSSSRQPTDAVRFSLSDLNPASFKSLTGLWSRTSLTPADLTPAEDFRWKSHDGLEIQGWLYRPQGQGKVRGTVVYVHGGPTMYSADAVNTEIQFYVCCGFNVLDPNYRGSTGFGVIFRDAIMKNGWGTDEQIDIRAGIEALLAAGIAEPGKIAITGTSFGGYSAWCAITHLPRELLAAAAPVCGITNLVIDYEARPEFRPLTDEIFGGSPEQVPEKYYNASPINFVQNIVGRLLIIQGLQDATVSPENVRVVTIALQKAGIQYELLTFEDEGHGIVKPKNQRKLYLELANFFENSFR
jgi:dipeptidyl aminopeptidase/acylaminoacyl peptidase